MAISISVLILVIGLISLFTLPVEQYPDIAPPTVYVSANYTGADAEAVLNSVIMPLEESINGVENMMYISSTATNAGSATIQVYFKQGTDPDMAAVNVQNCVSKAQGLLPAEVTKIGVTTQKRQTSFLQIGALVSTDGRYDQTFLANYLDINVIPQIKRIEGVGDVMELGDTYSMRIWLKPERMAQYGLVPSDVTAVLGEQNIEAPTGSLGENSKNVFQFTMKYRGRLKSVEEFQNTVVRSQSDGSVLRLKDVADVALGTLTYSFRSEMDSKPAVLFMMFQTAGSNATAVNKQITAQIDEMRKSLPEGTEFVTMMSSNDFLFASIHNVVETLVIAIILVILVVYFFLQDFKSTLIPSISIIVSLVGTFACLVAAGFSLNILTLFALVLAIGTVVDDAIVVVEAVKNHISNGEKPLPATIAAMREVSGPIVSTALVISCVFVPTLLLPGVSGKLFEQFAVTIGMSIIISAFCALSLSPALSSRLLKAGNSDTIWLLGPFFNIFNKGFNKARDWYVNACSWLIRRMWLSILLLAAMTALLFPLAKLIPSGFLPNEDQGYLFGGVELPDNTSLNVTEKTSAEMERIIREDPGVEVVTTVNGFNLISTVQSSSNSFFFISLKPWSQRKGPDMTADAIAARLKNKLNAKISSGMAYVVPPPPLPGVGTSGDVTFLLEDRQGIGEEFLASNTSKFIEAAGKRSEIADISNFMSPSNLQYNLNVNTEQATLQNMNVDEIYATIQAYMGSTFLNNFNIYGQEWQVYMQADAPYRDSIDKLSMFYVRNNDGDPVPLDSVIDVTHGWAPEFLIRQNMFNSSQLNITPAEGYSSGQVMNALEEVFAQTMPAGMGYGYSGMSYQEKQAQHGITIGMIFAASAIFVFLILASLYESWSLPVAVFMTVPIAILGAFAALWIFGQQLNIYSEIGLIVLIALAAKNAILIVEFAVLELKQGKDLLTSTLDAARIRLRPILMTSIAFIMGCLPLALATGAGAAARQVVGIGVIGGMITAVFIGVFFIPSFFYLIAKLAKLDKKAALERQEKAS